MEPFDSPVANSGEEEGNTTVTNFVPGGKASRCAY